jgi:hypothetical protein
MVDFLDEKDVRNGEYRDNWAGFRNKKCIKFFFYEYEKHLRDSTSSSLNLMDLPNSDRWLEHDIEHISPKNPPSGGSLGTAHDKNKDRIGNLALIDSEDNNELGNKPYVDKREKYEDTVIKVLEEVAEKNSEWKIRDVKERNLDLIEFAKERWSVQPLNYTVYNI